MYMHSTVHCMYYVLYIDMYILQSELQITCAGFLIPFHYNYSTQVKRRKDGSIKHKVPEGKLRCSLGAILERGKDEVVHTFTLFNNSNKVLIYRNELQCKLTFVQISNTYCDMFVTAAGRMRRYRTHNKHRPWREPLSVCVLRLYAKNDKH